MYKGWLIREASPELKFNKGMLCAKNWRTGMFINPLYKTWDALKSVIDEIK